MSEGGSSCQMRSASVRKELPISSRSSRARTWMAPRMGHRFWSAVILCGLVELLAIPVIAAPTASAGPEFCQASCPSFAAFSPTGVWSGHRVAASPGAPLPLVPSPPGPSPAEPSPGTSSFLCTRCLNQP